MLGKCAIAARLIPCEDDRWVNRLVAQRACKEHPIYKGKWHDDHWLDWVFAQMVRETLSPEEFVEKNRSLRFVTFNYDRSLEHGLSNMLQGSFGARADVAEAAVKKLSIVHVYGLLGSYYQQDPTYRPYTNDATNVESLKRAARGISLIGEGRAAEDQLRLAREYIRSSDRIVFLGFGFDPTNMARLAEGGTFANKSFCACVRGLTNGELAETRRAFWPQERLTEPIVFHETSTSTNLSALREMLGFFH